MLTPSATYRIQLSSTMTLLDVKRLVTYFQELGIDTLYLSPLFKAHQTSTHGYDVVDHTQIDPKIGSEETLEELSNYLKLKGMGILLDIVPNHMCITDKDNFLWQDVLRYGEASRIAPWFSIDWAPESPDLQGKVLQPFLGESLFEAISAGSLVLEEEEGSSAFVYGSLVFPCDPTRGVSLDGQHFRLDLWRRGSSDCNYRRFFNISELACLNVERLDVFEHVHKLFFHLVEKGWIQGARIDHIDGLLDPAGYLRNLQEYTGGLYTIVEKILAKGETCPSDWEVQGTTGYEFLTLCTGLFVKETLEKEWRGFTGITESLEEIEVQSKRHVLFSSMQSELKSLFKTLPAHLHNDIVELVVHLPVYRTYSKGAITDKEKVLVERATPALLEFLHNHPDYLLRLQQLTGPVMAKGFEDTALYRYMPMTALNEVGSALEPTAIEEFHKVMIERQQKYPLSLSASSTHDTKRSEDTRARIAVLSEIPREWEESVQRLSALSNLPDKNLEWLFFQTLVGTWPLRPLKRQEHREYVERIAGYMLKAAKEGKVRSCWHDPDPHFEEELIAAIHGALEPSSPFWKEAETTIRPLVRPGLLNALSMVGLKMMAPGVPDLYQGCETFRSSVTDPDSRRSVDYKRLVKMAEELDLAHDMLQILEDGRLKFFYTKTLLQLRKRYPDLFQKGAYKPIEAKGGFGFIREWEGKRILFCTGRFFVYRRAVEVDLGKGSWVDVVTQETYEGKSELCHLFPFHVLESV